MKLWKVSWKTVSGISIVKFVETRAGTFGLQAIVKASPAGHDESVGFTVERVDIPAGNRRQLASWLNGNLISPNLPTQKPE